MRPAYLDPTRLTGEGGADAVARIVNVALVEGRGYPVFAALFGYGIVQLAGRSASDDPRATVGRLRHRGGWLILLGAIHATCCGRGTSWARTG